MSCQNSSVGIATGYRVDGWGSIHGRGKKFFPTLQHPDWLCGPPSLLSNGDWGLFTWGVKWLGHEADYSPPSSAEIKNVGAIPPLPHIFMVWCLIN
jgi:hypothetical protein